jgi:hypothetical protein
MRQLRNPTRNAIRRIVEPRLATFGFVRSKEKTFFRVRGPLLDQIHVGFGGWGSSYIYVYYSVHLVEDPVTSQGTYHVGGRLTFDWSASDHDVCEKSTLDMLDKLESMALPFFEAVTLPLYEGAWWRWGGAAAFAALARNDIENARIYLVDSIHGRAPLIYSSGYPGWRSNEEPYARKEAHIKALKEALDAIDSGKVEAWRRKVRAMKLESLGIVES